MLQRSTYTSTSCAFLVGILAAILAYTMTTHTINTDPVQSETHQDHHHHHHHNHDHAGLGAANAAHFDTHVAGPNSMQGVFTKLYSAIEEELSSRADWFGLRAPLKSGGSGSPIRLLDYACGGGHGTKTLLPYVDEAVGMDVSGKSVEAYDTWAKENGLEGVMRGVQANLMLQPGASESAASDPKLFDFDLIIVVMALHHVSDPALLIKQLAPRLKAGTGHLVVVDWDAEGRALKLPQLDDKSQKVIEQTTDHHHLKGFSRGEMKAFYEAAGCGDTAFERIERETSIGDLFISKGVRQAE